MYFMIGFFALLIISITLIRAFSYRNWKLVYSAYGSEEYFRILTKLKREGIKVRISAPFRGTDSRIDRFKDNTQYEIYVKKDEEHLAVKALQRRI